MESLYTTVSIKITFSNLKSVEYLEFDKKKLKRTSILKRDFKYFLSKKEKTANFDHKQNKDAHTKVT